MKVTDPRSSREMFHFLARVGCNLFSIEVDNYIFKDVNNLCSKNKKN